MSSKLSSNKVAAASASSSSASSAGVTISSSSLKIYNELISLDGVGDTKAKELIKAGVSKMSDLRLKKYSQMLPGETLFALKYPVDKRLSWDYVNSLVEFFRKNVSTTITGVGSYRRQRAILKDVDVITTLKLSTISDKIKNLGPKLHAESTFQFIGEYSSGTKKLSMIVSFRGKYVRVDFFKVKKEEMYYALLHYTGSRQFNIRVRAKAKQLGYKLNQFGLFDSKNNNKLPNPKSERDILKFIGVTYKPPPARG